MVRASHGDDTVMEMDLSCSYVVCTSFGLIVTVAADCVQLKLAEPS
jgi:hypothetical protein